MIEKNLKVLNSLTGLELNKWEKHYISIKLA